MWLCKIIDHGRQSFQFKMRRMIQKWETDCSRQTSSQCSSICDTFEHDPAALEVDLKHAVQSGRPGEISSKVMTAGVNK